MSSFLKLHIFQAFPVKIFFLTKFNGCGKIENREKDEKFFSKTKQDFGMQFAFVVCVQKHKAETNAKNFKKLKGVIF